MRFDGFGRTLLFAGSAAAAWPLFALLLAPVLGGAGAALRLFLVLLGALYVAGLGSQRRRALGAGLVLLGLAGTLAVLAPQLASVALGAALLLGVARSVLLYAARPVRALALEAALLGGGLALALAIAAPGLVGVALAVFAFFVVQSLFFLVGGGGERPEAPESLDRFELARTRLEELLEER